MAGMAGQAGFIRAPSLSFSVMRQVAIRRQAADRFAQCRG